MNLAQMRQQMSATGRVEIGRDRGRSVAMTVFYVVFAALGAGCVVGGAAGGGPGLALAGVVVLGIGAFRTVQTLPGVTGQAGVVVDGTGVRIGARSAPWSQIAAVNLQTVRSRQIYGSKSRIVTIADAAGRSPFHAPGTQAPSWPWGGQLVPRLLVASQLDVATFLHEQLLAARDGRLPTTAPPTHTPPTYTPPPLPEENP